MIDTFAVVAYLAAVLAFIAFLVASRVAASRARDSVIPRVLPVQALASNAR